MESLSFSDIVVLSWSISLWHVVKSDLSLFISTCNVDSLTTNLVKDFIVAQLHPWLLEDPTKDYIIVKHMKPIDMV